MAAGNESQRMGISLPRPFWHDDILHSASKNEKREFKMTAYWVARAKINDPVGYKKYTDLVPDIVKKFGGKPLARGGEYRTLEGPETFERFIVVEFPSLEQAVACHESPEYQEARKFRLNGVGQNELTIVEAGDATK
jgi:uncharacterized protein (DUF1330 family)